MDRKSVEMANIVDRRPLFGRLVIGWCIIGKLGLKVCGLFDESEG